MDVSVIIPAMNESGQVADAVRSAREAGAAEVIVVDGGSGDATRAEAADAGASVLTSPPGRAIQQHLAAAEATGEVLLFLHADCRLPGDGIEQIVRVLRSPWVVAGAFRQRIDASGVAYRLLEQGNSLRARWCRLPYGDQGLFCRRRTFDQAGGVPLVPLMDDLLLARRLRRLGRLVLLPGPLSVSARRWQRHGVVGQTLRNWGLLIAERSGVPLAKLARRYARHDDASNP